VGGDPLQSHSMLLLVDPGCPSINDLISGLDYAYPNTVKVGGIAGQLRRLWRIMGPCLL
jgi:small ligand-binding sensory domain FIST